MSRKVYWHLPGFVYFFYLNQVLISLMKEYPERFMDGYEIGSVYGTFPGAIWNGGRAVFGLTDGTTMTKILDTYNKQGVPVRFTWTNSLLEEKHIHDTYCNLIMDKAANGMNQVLVNAPVLEDYLRREYPNFKYISSTTKRITDVIAFKEELSRDYFMAVLDYDLNHDEQVLEAISSEALRVEILVDEICYPGCPKRAEHYRDESLRQLCFDKDTLYDCPNKKTRPSFEECMKRPAFISREELPGYIDRGFANFKLVGRGLPTSMVIDSYIYYLVKEEEQSYIRRKLEERLKKLPQK